MKIIEGLPREVQRMSGPEVSLAQEYLPWPCTDAYVYLGSPEEHYLLLVKRREPPTKGLLWFPGGRRLKNLSLEQGLTKKLWEECGIDLSNGEGRIVSQLPTRDFSSKDDLPNEPGLNYSVLKTGFHATSTNFLVKIKELMRYKVKIDSTSSSYEWVARDQLENYGRSIGGFHPYFAEVLNDASRALGVSKRIRLKEINTKYGLPDEDFDR